MAAGTSLNKTVAAEAAGYRSIFNVVSSFKFKKKAGAAGYGSTDHAMRLVEAYEDACKGWFWSTDENGALTYLSRSMSELLGGEPNSWIGHDFSQIFSHADADVSGRRTMPFLLAKQSPFERIILSAPIEDRDRCWSISGKPQFDRNGRFCGYLGSAVDVTEHRKSAEHASLLAQYDALTGLLNRRRMSEVLEESLRASQQLKRSCAILLIDLDRFKQVNDTLGHPAGDQLLKQVANRLVSVVGDSERVFRLGGDEFQVLVLNSENRGIIGDLATDIIRSLSQPYLIDGNRCIIGASMGIAVGPLDGASKDELVRNADLALYASKEGGRGRFRFFSSELLQRAEDRRTIEDDLREALSREQLSVAYQPIVDTRTNRMTGVEALLRWQHPTRGSVSPALFIPIAEDAGLIKQIGNWVLRKACEDAASWPRELRVAVNVSPIQFASEAFPGTVSAALDASGLPANRLELEITEGVFLSQSDDTDAVFSSLKKIGVRLALDDFGTGYSSLGYLQSAPFDKIKIDQSFVKAATKPESRNSAIIAAIVALAEALDMETTAEGVEYMDQLRLIRDLRVSHAQGWVFSKAVTSAELASKLQLGEWIMEPAGPARQRSERQSMYRKVGVINGHRYDHAVVRNLSETGALIDDVPSIPVDTLILMDFGDGQVSFGRVIRSEGQKHGIAFEQHLVDDGDGGLCTSHRVSQYLLSTIGLPNASNPILEDDGSSPTPLEKLAQHMGLTLAPRRPVAERAVAACYWADAPPGEVINPTVRDLSTRLLETFEGDDQSRESAKRDLRNHILPRFGQLRVEEVSEADLFAWLAAKVDVEQHPAGTDDRLHSVLNQIWALAAKLGVPGAKPNPLERRSCSDWRAAQDELLTSEAALKLLDASLASPNKQLKFILALMMTTGVRQGELLRAEWDHIDVDALEWNLPDFGPGKPRRVQFDQRVAALLSMLPRSPGCPYLIANPKTKQPFRSVQASWEAVKIRAGFPHIELDDLRYCAVDDAKIHERLGLGVLGTEQNEGPQVSPTHEEEAAYECA